MKKCPRCELNYIEDWEEICSVCEATLNEIKNPTNVKGIVVSKDNIQNPISGNAVYQIVRYLVGDYGDDDVDIYDTESPFSYRSTINKLKQNVPYAIIRYKQGGAFKQYSFDGDKAWTKFFLANPRFNKLITGWGVKTLDELYGMAKSYHNTWPKMR